MPHEPTFAERARSPAHRSFWRGGLARRAGTRSVDDWLIAQANARGYFGAWVVDGDVALDPALSLEEIVVGLCSPEAEADPRIFKLVLRILQSGKVDARRLLRLAKMERAEGVLHWLCTGVPQSERNAAFDEVAGAFSHPPRGWRSLDLRYDFGRLVRRPFRAVGAPWNRSDGS